ncbi:hypothetical protein L559_1486 [Bordetella pertussis STO1-CHOC-0017]|nr:hypothetical protein L559_1486 [Bordetella pertussis STO1-CHOC-0017]
MPAALAHPPACPHGVARRPCPSTSLSPRPPPQRPPRPGPARPPSSFRSQTTPTFY